MFNNPNHLTTLPAPHHATWNASNPDGINSL